MFNKQVNFKNGFYMSNEISLRAPFHMGMPSSPNKGKEEEPDQAPIDLLRDDVLSLIFQYAIDDCRDGNTLCAIRGVNRRFYNLLDTHNLKGGWARLQEKVKNPALRDLINQIVLVDHLVSQAITSAIDPDYAKSIAIEKTLLLNRIQSIGASSFSRFSQLTQNLRKKGAPIPDRHAVIGFELSPYESMQKHLDAALETIWARIQRKINFEGAPIPDNAQAISEWLNNPINAEKITPITELNLSEMDLTVLPPEIGNFSKLTTLSLSKNQFTILPSEIGNLSQLTMLFLSKNQLANLPPEIGNLSQLTKLVLSGNRFTSFPPQISNLSQLTTLDLDNNHLTSLPSQIGSLSQLTVLSLFNNQLRSIPSQIGSLSQLTMLYLSNNHLASIPPQIGNLSQLTTLYLSKNQLTILPPEIGNLTQLTTLYLSENQLASIPPQVGNLSKLRTLYLSYRNPFIFILDKDFHEPSPYQKLNFQDMANKFLACSNYKCRTPLASLCQAIHLGKGDECLKEAFELLSDEMQQRIRKTWAAISSSSSSSSEASSDLFADRASLTRAVIITLQGKWQSLSNDERNQTYAQAARLAGQPEADAYWGKTHAEENILRLADAMELAIPNVS